jgi:hypothetical protein
MFSWAQSKEKNLFMTISEDVSKEEVEAPPVVESTKLTDVNPPSNPP